MFYVSRFKFPFQQTTLALALYACYGLTFANDTDHNIEAKEIDQTLETIVVEAINPDEEKYVAQTASSILKSDAPLFETPRSVSVITQEQLQQKRATSIAEALDGVAGVSASPYGRRGFDDFIIRGQVSSDQIFVDGLRLTNSIFSSVELTGTDAVQVLKGPSSVEFGAGAAGGAVNLTTKRPQSESFYRAGLNYGSYQNISGTVDLNYAPNESEKGAFRLVARAGDQEDPVDYVYFKNYYLSPSYNFNLGEKTDLSLIASYQYREFVRSQGLPVYGGLIHNPNATYDRTRFAAEPDAAYKYDVYRLGHILLHRFDNGWKFKQNFAINHITMDADVVLANGTSPSSMFSDASTNAVTLRRTWDEQTRQVVNYAIDHSLSREFDFGSNQHAISLGVDLYKEDNDYTRISRRLANLNLNNPVYGSIPGAMTRHEHTQTDSHFIGVYARDQIKLKQNWLVGLAGRYDWAKTRVNTTNILTGETSLSSKLDKAFSGSASLMYNWNDVLAPYTSYAISFLPVTDVDVNGQVLNPEKGEQTEVGLKFQGLNNRLQGTLSAYQLTRKDAVVSTLADTTVKENVGKMVTRGVELEVAADVSDQWHVSFAYSHIPYAKIVQDKEPRRVGLPIDHVPEHSANLMTRYYFDTSTLGWYLGGGIRYEGVHVAQRPAANTANDTYARLPAYTLVDVQTGYKAPHWSTNFSVKNLFDKEYYAGTTPNGALVSYGMPRTFNFGINLNF